MYTSLYSLPVELLRIILAKLDPVDLSHTRLVSKRLLTYSDDPSMWRHIHLKKPSQPLSDKEECQQQVLWKLNEIAPILHPHLSLIHSISICGVRDNIVQYILLNCPKLEELTIDGWMTLSEHAFALTKKLEMRASPYLPLRKLRLQGEGGMYCTSLDAATFGRLMHHCPHLEELSIVGCQVHLHADYLLQSISKKEETDNHDIAMRQVDAIAGDSNDAPNSSDSSQSFTNSLRYLTLATKRTWSTQHIVRLFQICSRLCWLGLVPISFGNTHTNIPLTNQMLEESNDEGENLSILRKDINSIEDQEITNYDTIYIYRCPKTPIE